MIHRYPFISPTFVTKPDTCLVSGLSVSSDSQRSRSNIYPRETGEPKATFPGTMISREEIYVFSRRVITLHTAVLQFSPRIIFLSWNFLPAFRRYRIVYMYFPVKPYVPVPCVPASHFFPYDHRSVVAFRYIASSTFTRLTFEFSLLSIRLLSRSNGNRTVSIAEPRVFEFPFTICHCVAYNA